MDGKQKGRIHVKIYHYKLFKKKYVRSVEKGLKNFKNIQYSYIKIYS